ncbi:MAG: hypothetical protein U9Q07_11025, partial [Planctomycetota bacterium]|nr:hypothetical protein [Planctomycetota bacterium]
DKNVFHGTAKDKLVAFVKCHRVILPHVLCVECAVSEKGDPPDVFKDPKQLTSTLLELVKNGAYMGKSPARIVEEERSTNTTIESLIDVEQTEIMREAILNESPDIEKARRMCDEVFKPITDIVQGWASQFYQTIRKKKKEKDFREEVDEGNLVGRLKKHLQAADEKKSDILDKYYGNGRKDVFAGELKVSGTFFDELCLLMIGFDRGWRVA